MCGIVQIPIFAVKDVVLSTETIGKVFPKVPSGKIVVVTPTCSAAQEKF